MRVEPRRFEIDHRTIKLLVGLIALFLASLTNFLAKTRLTSISASYHEGGWPRDTFVGCLFAIGTFLMAYNGRTGREMILSKVAAVSALAVAMFPCGCGSYPELIPHIHGISAAVMFLVLASFSYIFSRRASAKGHRQARRRAWIYRSCTAAIVISIVVVAVDDFSGGALTARISRLTFYGERMGLIAFGISWLTASHVFPWVSSHSERFSLLRKPA